MRRMELALSASLARGYTSVLTLRQSPFLRSRTNRGENSSDWRRRNDGRRGTGTRPWRAGATGTAAGRRGRGRPGHLGEDLRGSQHLSLAPWELRRSEWEVQGCVPGFPVRPSFTEQNPTHRVTHWVSFLRLPLFLFQSFVQWCVLFNESAVKPFHVLCLNPGIEGG